MRRLAALPFVLMAPMAAAQAPPALLVNPGFEQVDDEGWAVGWERWPAASPEPGAVSVDANMPFRGARALRLHHENPGSYTRAQQVIAVEPNQRYYFRVRMKGEGIIRAEGVGSMGCRMYIEGLGGRDYATKTDKGSFDWKEMTVEPLKSGGGGRITVMCYLHLSTGTVWYDDVEVIQVTPDFEARLRQQQFRRRMTADLELGLAVADTAGDRSARQELQRLAERMRTTGELAEQVDYRAGPPYFPLHAELFRIMARLNGRRLPGSRPLAAWLEEPFAPLPALGLAPPSPLRAAAVVMGRDERDQAVINLCNLGDEPLRLRVAVQGLETTGAPQVTLRETVHVETGSGNLLADALPRLGQGDAGPTLDLPPGVFRQLWLDLSSTGSRPGPYRGMVELRGPGGMVLEVPLTVEVLPVTLPDKLPVITWNYSYQRDPLVKDRWAQARADLVAHHINAYCWPSWHLPWPGFDESGKLLPMDWTAFDAALKSHDRIQWLLLWPQFEWARNLKLRQELEIGSPVWEERSIAWFRALIAGLKERGFGYDRVAWYPTDEPTTATRVNQQVVAAQAIRKADPQALVLANPYSACTKPLLDRMAPVTDIWCPELSWGKDGLLPFFRQTSKVLWTYQVLGLHAPAFERYRLAFWDCWRHGITGHGFWAYASCGGSNWDRHDAPRQDYAVVYDGDREELIPSRRWEAWREGVEDYSYLWLLQQAEGERAAPLLRDGVNKLLAEPSPEALASLREQVLRRLAQSLPR